MAQYVIEETARYTVEAESAERAMEYFLDQLEAGPSIVNTEVIDRFFHTNPDEGLRSCSACDAECGGHL